MVQLQTSSTIHSNWNTLNRGDPKIYNLPKSLLGHTDIS